IRSVFDPIIDLLPSLATLAVLTVGAVRARADLVDVGDIVTAAYLLTVMAFPVRAIGFVLGDLPRSLVGHDRISRVADARGYLRDGRRPLPGAGGIDLTVEGISLAVQDEIAGPHIPLLHDISFTVPAGATVAIVGSTGAGKTTLMDVVTRLTDPTSGSVQYNGIDVRELTDEARTGAVASGSVQYNWIDVRELTDEARTGAVAYVSQSSLIFEGSSRNNVDLSTDSHMNDDEVRQALRIAQADGFVSELPEGIHTIVGERGASLSGGQRQRVARSEERRVGKERRERWSPEH